MSDIAAENLDTTPRSMGVRGWILFCMTAVLCAACGWVAARMAGFPLYWGYQGVLTQQPMTVTVASLVAGLLAVLVATRLGTSLVMFPGIRMGAALGCFALAGFSLRGGTMAGVLAAGNGGETFLLLAGELAVLGLIAWGANIFAGRLCRSNDDESHLGGVAFGVIQLVVFALVIWIAGKSYLKGQAIGTVFCAGLMASWVAHLAAGKTWKHGWSVPIICGVAGYIVNAFAGDTTPSLVGPAAAFSVASPLDYAAFGPIGIMLGEMIHRHESPEKGDEHGAESKWRTRRRVRE